MLKIDTDWFNDQIRGKDLSQRKLSQSVKGRNGKPLDQATVSLMLRGRRAISFDVARQLAHVLDLPLKEVLFRAGIAPAEEGKNYTLFGYIDGSGEMKPAARARESVPGPEGLPAKTIAIRYQTAKSHLALLDGWILFAEKPCEPDHNMVSRLCLVSPAKGSPRVGWVLRGYRAGTYNIVCNMFGPKDDLENAEITWASPVLWVQPGT